MPPAERRPRPRPVVDRTGSAGDDPAAPPREAPGTADRTAERTSEETSGRTAEQAARQAAERTPADAPERQGARTARPQQRTRAPQQRQAPESRAPQGQASRTQGPRGQGHRGQRSPGRTVEETSAGGLVVRRVDGVPHVAVIARINRGGRLEWCLPKGHLEGEETAEQAAVREIAEETGIEGRVLQALGSIDYWFSVEGRRIHKTVHHYLLEATGGTLGVEGDPDAEAVDAAWVPVPELPERLAFSNERRIARMAGSILAEGA